MLDAYIIDRLKKEEQEREERERQRPQLEVPEYPTTNPEPERKSDRGVVTIVF